MTTARAERQLDEVEPSDGALVHAARAGDDEAAGALLLRHSRRARRLASRLMGRRDEDVEDIVQESLLASLQNLAELREPESFAAWLSGIIVRMARRTRRQRRRLRSDAHADVVDPDALASPAPSADVISECRLLEQTLQSLPEAARDALLLYEVAGLSVGEVAFDLQLTKRASRRQIEGARARLRRRTNGDV